MSFSLFSSDNGVEGTGVLCVEGRPNSLWLQKKEEPLFSRRHQRTISQNLILTWGVDGRTELTKTQWSFLIHAMFIWVYLLITVVWLIIKIYFIGKCVRRSTTTAMITLLLVILLGYYHTTITRPLLVLYTVLLLVLLPLLSLLLLLGYY